MITCCYGNTNVTYTVFNFPAGEMHVRLNQVLPKDSVVDITWQYKKNDDILELLLFCNALKEGQVNIRQLTIPYFPFSRQDRVAVPGESFSLRVMCDLINSLNAKNVIVYDPHSTVLSALLNNCTAVTQRDIFLPYLLQLGPAVLISPDAGATKKTYEVATALGSSHHKGVVECSKKRDPKTGDITGTNVFCAPGYLDNKTCVILDDICDGGRTFIEIAKEIRAQHQPNKIVLMVTHGLFTKGLQVFDGFIDEIYTHAGKHPVTPLLQDTMNRRAV